MVRLIQKKIIQKVIKILTPHLIKFRKLVGLLIFGFIAAASAQDSVEIECDYYTNANDEYVCFLFALDFIPRNTSVTFIGEHEEGRNESQVDVVRMYFSDIEHIIPEIYTTFPNLNELDIEFSGLINIDQIPTDLPNFAFFISLANWVEVIQNNTFVNVGETLLYVDLIFNEIIELELDSFAGCGELSYLYMLLNYIPQPPVGTFWPLVNLIELDLEENNIGFIDDTLLANSTQLTGLWVEANHITRITPRLLSPLSLRYFGAYENDCIDRYFVLNEPIVETFMHASLQQCYNSFEGLGPDDTRTVRFDYQGPLRLNDEFGNQILVLN